MVNPDFVAIASGYQIESERISKREDLKESIEKMIDSPNPFFMEVVVGKEDNVFPMIPTGESVSNMRLN
jgi:acetolactate synthase-1/2/3 large subunit